MDNKIMKSEKTFQVEFENDTQIISTQTIKLLSEFYPIYLNNADISAATIEKDSIKVLKGLKFYKIESCMIEKMDDIMKFLNDKMKKFIIALYSVGVTFTYGVTSDGSKCDLILGISGEENGYIAKRVIEGLLSGIKLEEYKNDLVFENESGYYGMINGIPSLNANDNTQTFDLGSIIKTLNSEVFTILMIAKPVEIENIQRKMSEAIQIRDNCMAISKRSISRQESFTNTINESSTNGTQKSMNLNINGAPAGAVGAGIGALIGGIPGAFIGFGVGSSISGGVGKTNTESYTKAISEAINKGESVSIDIQNGFAIELMNLAENCIERLKKGRNIGIWETTITYSTNSKVTRDIMQGCVYGELAKPNEEILPPIVYKFENTELNVEIKNQHILIPKGLLVGRRDHVQGHFGHSICSYINSEELSILCTIPYSNSTVFELKEGGNYSLISPTIESTEKNIIGDICDGEQVLSNKKFEISNEDLNKHTFVCGITGSGKSNTVKQLLVSTKKPFCVIESAKKEYRNMKTLDNEISVYTMGKPEMNCPKINPFYILPGINPQMHIDLLKDLFNAAFAFYGPMPYILEKCLHNIYKNKGWNLTLGYHPYLVNNESQLNLFDIEVIEKKYNNKAHKFVFPTMNDLKEEIENYIENELQYDGEMSGNIKTAIKTRLESLCVGTKGYMYNTNDILNWKEVLSSKCIFEMEGLADDSDKAFSVGLLVIFINEQRQTEKEISKESGNKLKHLLVIEEAHRLLKNVETERTSEGMGNPKGKAVEHFTNMIAEMRSYGQGVIIAEQIPTKIAPDVIKNTSNKIIHRIVALDDQEVIANSICVSSEKGIYLGVQKTGYALCHKEGMSLPVLVKVKKFEEGIVKDSDLYLTDIRKRFKNINKSMVEDVLHKFIDVRSTALLGNLLISDSSICCNAILELKEQIVKKIKIKNISFVGTLNIKNVISEVIVNVIMKKFTWGIFSNEKIVDSEIEELLLEAITSPYEEIIKELKLNLKSFYEEDSKNRGMKIIREISFNHYFSSDKLTMNLEDIVSQWFIKKDDKNIKEIIESIEKRGLKNVK